MNKVVPFERGNDYLMRRAQVNRQAGRLLDALALQRRATEQEDSPACRMDLAQTLCQMGCYEESNRILAGMLGEPDAPGDCYFGLCCNYMGMGQDELAYRAMVQFLARDPQALNRDEVSQMFNDLMRTRSAHRQAHLTRSARRALQLSKAAQARQDQGDLALAYRLMKRALRALKGSEDVNIRTQMAQLLNLLGRHQEAARQMDKVLSFRLVGDGSLGVAAKVYAQAGQASKAAAAILRLEAREPQGASLRLLLDACCAVGDDERVRLLAPRALRDTPYDRRLLHQCAVNRVRQGRPVEQAVSFWTRALRIDPGDTVARWGIKQATQGKLLPSMPYDYALPAAEAERWRHQLCQALVMDNSALLERFHRCRALEDRLRWALYGSNRQAMLMARRLLSRLDDPTARRMLSESLAVPWAGEDDSGQAMVNPDVSTIRVPPGLRRAMKNALDVMRKRHPGVAHRVVRLVLSQLTEGRCALPRDGAAISAALYLLAAGDRKEAPTVEQAAAVFGASPRRTARCALILSGMKEADCSQ